MVVHQKSSTISISPLSVLSFLSVTFLAVNGVSIFHDPSLPLSTASAQTNQNVIDSRTRTLRIALLTDALFSDAGSGAFG